MIENNLISIVIKQEEEICDVNQFTVPKAEEKVASAAFVSDAIVSSQEFEEIIPYEIQIAENIEIKEEKEVGGVVQVTNDCKQASWPRKSESPPEKLVFSKRAASHDKITLENEPSSPPPLKIQQLDQSKPPSTHVQLEVKSIRGPLKTQQKPTTKAVKCDVCYRIFSNLTNLTQHMKRIHPESLGRPLDQCKICGRKFVLKFAFLAHLDKDHPKFQCDYCGKILTQKPSLYSHVQTHLPSVQCKICGASIKQPGMQKHIKESHATERRFPCEICSKFFKSLASLRLHEKTHDKRFECNICRKKFSSQGALNHHQRHYHENPNGFSCELCGKTFSLKGCLKAHMEKPERCHLMPLGIEHESETDQHMMDKDLLKCSMCPKLWKSKDGLGQHMRVAHPKEIFQCELCKKSLKTKSSMKRHIEYHLRMIGKDDRGSRKDNGSFYCVIPNV